MLNIIFANYDELEKFIDEALEEDIVKTKNKINYNQDVNNISTEEQIKKTETTSVDDNIYTPGYEDADTAMRMAPIIKRDKEIEILKDKVEQLKKINKDLDIIINNKQKEFVSAKENIKKLNEIIISLTNQKKTLIEENNKLKDSYRYYKNKINDIKNITDNIPDNIL